MFGTRRRPGYVAGLLGTLLLSTACTSREQAGRAADEDSLSSIPLATSVQVEVDSSTARMVLHVTNPSSQPVTLEFTSGQRYDFAVRTAAGVDVWRWSADRSFMQALGTETIQPGATVRYAESWDFGKRTGSFVVVAELVATNHAVTETATFEIR